MESADILHGYDDKQMASTAAGVAVGSTVGHGLSSMLFGGGSQAAAPVAEPTQQTYEERRMGGTCEIQAKGTFPARGGHVCAFETDEIGLTGLEFL